MADKKESVFISYRRKTSKYPALLVFKELDQSGYDVFIDYESIDSGIFATEILNQIASRRHFIPILSPGCLDRITNPDDWLRREIEYAIEMRRNIVPMLFDRFEFESAKKYLKGKLSLLPDYNSVIVPDGYFDDAMKKLTTRFLKQPVKGTVKRAPRADHEFVRRTLRQAYSAVEGKDAQRAVKRYLGAGSPSKGTPPPGIGQKKQSTSAPAKPKVERSHRKALSVSTRPKVRRVLRRVVPGLQLFQGEVIYLNKPVAKDVSLFKAHAGRIIITDRRLIFKDLEDASYSFEIPMSKLRTATFTYRKLIALDQFTIQTSDGTKYAITASESMRFEIENTIKGIISTGLVP